MACLDMAEFYAIALARFYALCLFLVQSQDLVSAWKSENLEAFLAQPYECHDGLQAVIVLPLWGLYSVPSIWKKGASFQGDVQILYMLW